MSKIEELTKLTVKALKLAEEYENALMEIKDHKSSILGTDGSYYKEVQRIVKEALG